MAPPCARADAEARMTLEQAIGKLAQSAALQDQQETFVVTTARANSSDINSSATGGHHVITQRACRKQCSSEPRCPGHRPPTFCLAAECSTLQRLFTLGVTRSWAKRVAYRNPPIAHCPERSDILLE